ncbi:hypothetical protein DYB35_004803 [Aphanomyces astaci]|uniref:Importin N-terminal domain-containing protein n=2 Tax=Aphanomyces astaci TaxID=112090 RepID=A0A418D9J1_APHAT|nr:hypothetical protein DYB35_004803 [Aphanomyces astaci]
MDDSVVQAVEAMYASSSTGQTRSAADAFLRSFQTSPNAFAVSHAFLANAPTTARVVQLFAAQTISHLTLTPAQVSQLSSLFSLHHHERDIVRLLGTALVRNMEAGQGLDWLIQGPWDADVRISLLTLAAVESVAYTEAQNVIVYLGSSHAATKDTLLCMAEWVKLLDRDARHPDLVIKNPLTTYAIQVLHRGLDDTSDLFDAAVDLVVEVIRTYNSTLVDLPVIQWLIPQLMQLKPLFTAAAAQAFDLEMATKTGVKIAVGAEKRLTGTLCSFHATRLLQHVLCDDVCTYLGRQLWTTGAAKEATDADDSEIQSLDGSVFVGDDNDDDDDDDEDYVDNDDDE